MLLDAAADDDDEVDDRFTMTFCLLMVVTL